MNHLPSFPKEMLLPSGARPLGKLLSYLENPQFEEDPPIASLVLSYALLHALSANMKSLPVLSTLKVLSELPLHLDFPKVLTWEREGAWLKISEDDYQGQQAKNQYEQMIDGPRPSQAYAIPNDVSKGDMYFLTWSRWLAEQSSSDLKEILESSAHAIEQALRCYFQKSDHENFYLLDIFQNDNLVLFFNDLALTSQEKNNLKMLALLMEEGACFPHCLTALKNLEGGLPAFFASLSKVSETLLGISNCWEDLGLSPSESHAEVDISVSGFASLSKVLGTEKLKHLVFLKKGHTPSSLFGYGHVLTPPQNTHELFSQQWEKEFKSIPSNSVVYIISPPHSSDNHYLSLLCPNGLFVRSDKEEELKQLLKYASLAQVPVLLDSSWVCVEKISTLLSRNNHSLPLVVLFGKEEAIQKYRHAVDRVFEVSHPSFAQRQNFLKDLTSMFPPDLLDRVAQACVQASTLITAKKWLINNPKASWVDMRKFSLSLTKTGKKITLPQIDVANIPPLVAEKEVFEMLDKWVELFEHPHLHNKATPKGMLLEGPSGCGKTLFVQHLAQRSKVTLFAPSSSDIAKDPSLVQKIYQEASMHAPCILFFDEGDGLIEDPITPFGINLELRNVVNAMMAAIDGVSQSEGVVTIIATHRGIKPDPAAIRSGRLSQMLKVDYPSSVLREKMWQAYIDKEGLTLDTSLKELSVLSRGLSGADIAEVSSRIKLAQEKKKVTTRDLSMIMDNLFWGDSPTKQTPQDERFRVAVHEMGHALVALSYNWLVPRVTCRPKSKGDFEGVTYILREEEGSTLMDRTKWWQYVQILLGGLVAEEVVFGSHGTGVLGDLKSLNNLVRHAQKTSLVREELLTFPCDTSDWSDTLRVFVEEEGEVLVGLIRQATRCVIESNKGVLIEASQKLQQDKEWGLTDLEQFRKSIVSVETTVPVLSKAHQQVKGFSVQKGSTLLEKQGLPQTLHTKNKP